MYFILWLRKYTLNVDCHPEYPLFSYSSMYDIQSILMNTEYFDCSSPPLCFIKKMKANKDSWIRFPCVSKGYQKARVRSEDPALWWHILHCRISPCTVTVLNPDRLPAFGQSDYLWIFVIILQLVWACEHLAITPVPCSEFRVSGGVTAWHMVRDKLMLGPIMSREMSQS